MILLETLVTWTVADVLSWLYSTLSLAPTIRFTSEDAGDCVKTGQTSRSKPNTSNGAFFIPFDLSGQTRDCVRGWACSLADDILTQMGGIENRNPLKNW